jgi:hypothetical protein
LRPDKWLLSISKAAPLSPYKFNKILIWHNVKIILNLALSLLANFSA